MLPITVGYKFTQEKLKINSKGQFKLPLRLETDKHPVYSKLTPHSLIHIYFISQLPTPPSRDAGPEVLGTDRTTPPAQTRSGTGWGATGGGTAARDTVAFGPVPGPTRSDPGRPRQPRFPPRAGDAPHLRGRSQPGGLKLLKVPRGTSGRTRTPRRPPCRRVPGAGRRQRGRTRQDEPPVRFPSAGSPSAPPSPQL